MMTTTMHKSMITPKCLIFIYFEEEAIQLHYVNHLDMYSILGIVDS